MKTLTDDEVAARAQQWARLHKNEKYRDKMDDVLTGISKADQRRVYLCGQRMVGGLPLKVIPASPAAPGKEDANGNKNKAAQRRPDAVAGGTGNSQKEKTVAADRSVEESSKRRSRAKHKK